MQSVEPSNLSQSLRMALYPAARDTSGEEDLPGCGCRGLHLQLRSPYQVWDWLGGERGRKVHLPSLRPSLWFIETQEERWVQHRQEEEEIFQDLVIVEMHPHHDFLYVNLQEGHQVMEEMEVIQER